MGISLISCPCSTMSTVFCSLYTILFTMVLSSGQQYLQELQCSLLLLMDFSMRSMLQQRGQKFIIIILMKTGKSAQKAGSKNLNERIEKPNVQEVVSPLSKKVLRQGPNLQFMKRNSIRSIQLKDRDRDRERVGERHREGGRERIKQEERPVRKEDGSKAREKKDSGESNRRKNQNQVKEPQEQVLKIGAIPLFYTINDHQEIQASNVMSPVNDNNPSCISEHSRFDCAINESEWQIDKKLIGAGSRGLVYKAFNRFTGKIAAVKKIKINAETNDREVKIISELKHPNIVEYYGFTRSGSDISIYMEFIPTTLRNIYTNFGGVIPYENVRRYTKQLVEAVQCIHNLKIIHKDIKCENILLNQRGVIKLTDFGESKQFDQSTSLSANRAADCSISLRGSVRWTAPQSLKTSLYTRKSDIWSVGCTVLEMATGKMPWSQLKVDNYIADIMAIYQSQQPPFIPSQLPQDLKDFLNMCLVLDVQKRKTTDQLLKAPFLTKK